MKNHIVSQRTLACKCICFHFSYDAKEEKYDIFGWLLSVLCFNQIREKRNVL
jgi:hypothetical protein